MIQPGNGIQEAWFLHWATPRYMQKVLRKGYRCLKKTNAIWYSPNCVCWLDKGALHRKSTEYLSVGSEAILSLVTNQIATLQEASRLDPTHLGNVFMLGDKEYIHCRVPLTVRILDRESVARIKSITDNYLEMFTAAEEDKHNLLFDELLPYAWLHKLEEHIIKVHYDHIDDVDDNWDVLEVMEPFNKLAVSYMCGNLIIKVFKGARWAEYSNEKGAALLIRVNEHFYVDPFSWTFRALCYLGEIGFTSSLLGEFCSLHHYHEWAYSNSISRLTV
jgi:hypothetical protein